MADATQDWCYSLAKCEPESRLMVLTGPFGCGKTECLRAAHTYARDIMHAVWPHPWAKPFTTLFINFADFVREQVRNNNHEQMEDALSSGVLFIDDVGSEEDEYKSGTPTRILGDMLGKMEHRFVFITTNVPMNQWRQRWDGRVEDRLLRSRARCVNLWRPELRAESFAVWRMRHEAA